MLTYVVIGLVVIVIGLVIAITMQPDDFKISRSAKMAASPSAIFEQVNNLHNWEAWSPRAKLDPSMKQTYTGPESGVGASYSWVGNKNVGEGSNTIIESQPSEVIKMQLAFLKPFKANNDVTFAFRPEGDDTMLTWGMAGKNNFMGKAIGLIINCEKMVGNQFDQGLASMKSIVENKTLASTGTH